MGYLYVLDYSDSTVCQIELDEEEENNGDIDIEDVFHRCGIKESNCAWMYSNNMLDIIPLFKEPKNNNLKED